MQLLRRSEAMTQVAISSDHQRGSIWYYLTGVLSVLVGVFAITKPMLATVAITQLIGAFCLVNGVILLISAVFGKAKKHRILDILSALLRTVVGVLLLVNVISGIVALTMVLASLFLVEGIVGLVFAFKLRGKNSAWIWVLLNSLVAFVLGGLLFQDLPGDAAWGIGLLFGINSIFLGLSFIMFAAAMPKAQEA